MEKYIQVYLEDKAVTITIPRGTCLVDLLKDNYDDSEKKILGAFVNNKLRELTYRVYKPKNIRFIDYSDVSGRRMYKRSLSFVLYKAVKDTFHNHTSFKVEHSISNGLYCRLGNKNIVLTKAVIDNIKNKMITIIEQDFKFIRKEMPTEDAIKLFESSGLGEKTNLLRTRGNLYTSVYYLGDTVDYYYGFLVESTKQLKVFDLIQFNSGMLLLFPEIDFPTKPSSFNEQPKLLKVFSEFKRWGKLMGISNIGDLNRSVTDKEVSELIKIAEALQEKKISQIADKIKKHRKTTRIILISGPSSSGKTTFGKRLSVQLKVAGLKPLNLSLDDYFVNREDTPKDEKGEYDFESVNAIDINKFNSDVNDLLLGREIDLPKFSFETGQRYYDGEKMSLSRKQILVIEGIHALNPELTHLIPDESKFKIYVSALTSISIDGHNRIPSTDNRLIRRIVRDYRYRSYSAVDTLRRWSSVRRGEEKYIFPYQEEADVMFNSALSYELGVLKTYAEPILKEVLPNMPEYAEANRLLKFFSFFRPISPNEIPPTSLMREFLGGSTFKY
ncbi:MAG: nucleoside kinase [Marinifilaceae bacterium]|jgi:uridine kinase|nr:nucleoside kinase [Marinifilaceae bacterium]